MDPFFTTKISGEGTGLGMSMVNDVVESLGGQINIDSVEGEYTNIDLSFKQSS